MDELDDQEARSELIITAHDLNGRRCWFSPSYRKPVAPSGTLRTSLIGDG
nr:hypothetical protein [Methylobacterium sp.]